MKGRPSDDRALDFRGCISFTGPTPYALHIRTDSLFGKLYTRECAQTIDLPSACKGNSNYSFISLVIGVNACN